MLEPAILCLPDDVSAAAATGKTGEGSSVPGLKIGPDKTPQILCETDPKLRRRLLGGLVQCRIEARFYSHRILSS